MTLRSEIRDALLAGHKTAAQLVDACTSAGDANAMANNLYALKKEGKVKIVGSIEGRNNYALDTWPESAIRGNGKRAKAAPPPRAGRGKKARKTKRARAAEALPPMPMPPNGAASFRHHRQRHARADQARHPRGPRARGIHPPAHVHRAHHRSLESHNGVIP